MLCNIELENKKSNGRERNFGRKQSSRLASRGLMRMRGIQLEAIH